MPPSRVNSSKSGPSHKRNLCITCTMPSGTERKLMPIVVTDEQRAALLEWLFRAQNTNAPHGCGLERCFSSMLWLQGNSSGARRAFCGSGVARAAPVEHCTVQGQIRIALAEHSVAPGRAQAAFFEYQVRHSIGNYRKFIGNYRKIKGQLLFPPFF